MTKLKERAGTAPRRFTLVDAMILVAASAGVFAVLRWTDDSELWREVLTEVVSPGWWRVDPVGLVAVLAIMAAPVAVAVSLATLVIRLRGSRPAWRRLVRQPGFVAGLAAAGASLVGAAFALIPASIQSFVDSVGRRTTSLRNQDFTPGQWLEAFARVALPVGGVAVVASWATLALVGRWRAEAGWVDRLGRLVGLGWVVLAIVEAVYLLLNHS